MWIICIIYLLVNSQIPCLETTIINLVSDAQVASQIVFVHHLVDASLCLISNFIGIMNIDVG